MGYDLNSSLCTDKAPHVERILEVEPGRLCCIIGTVFVDMPLKPTILDEIGQDYNFVPPPPRETYFSEKDKVLLEDESGRMQLIGEKMKTEIFVSGIQIFYMF